MTFSPCLKPRALRGCILLAAAVLGLAAANADQALAGSTERADFALRFSTQAPGRATAVDLDILYKATGDPEAKPSQIRRLVIDAPDGTEFHPAGFPRCTATDAELRLRGRRACPARGLVGQGLLTVATGLVAPLDLLRTDVRIYTTATGFVEVVQQQGQDRTLGIDRVTIAGTRLSASPPVTPGGPPDGESAVRQIDFGLFGPGGGRPAYVSTPPICPSTGRWSSQASFTFADGATTLVRDSSPCDRAANPRARLTLRLTGRTRRSHGRHCFSGPVRATVGGRDGAGARRAEFFVGHRRVARDRSRPLSRIVDRRRHRGRSHRHAVRLRVRMADGRLAGLRRIYRVCAENPSS